MKNLSLIVLNYNGLSHLKEYFNSVFEQTLVPNEVFMLDNCSTDGSQDFVKKYYPEVKIFKNKFNAGTAQGSNIAFTKTSGKFVIFQSNDIRLDKNCVKELYQFLQEHDDVGIVTSVLLNYYTYKESGKKIIDNAGGIADIFGFGMQNYPAKNLKNIPSSGEAFFSYGGSFIIKRELWNKVSGFDQRYFTLNDDLDLSWRVRLLGYKVMYTKKSFIYHKVSATLRVVFDRPTKHYWSERNFMRTFLKNTSNKHLLLIFPLYFLLLLAEIIFLTSRGKFALAFSDVKAILWNIFYLPETISMRLKVQSNKKPNNVWSLLIKSSLKLHLFKEFSKTI